MRHPLTTTNPRPRRPAPSGWLVLLAAFLTAALGATLGGCARVEATVRTQEALRAAGVQGAVISVQERGDETTVQVRYNSRASDQAGLQTEQDAAARVVWTNATVPLDLLKVTPDDNRSLPAAETRVYSRDDLHARFGARPEGLDRPPTGGGPRAIAYGLVGVLTALLILGVAGTIGGLLLRARIRRRRALAAATAWPAPGPADPGPAGLGPGSPSAAPRGSVPVPGGRQPAGRGGFSPPPPRRPAPGQAPAPAQPGREAGQAAPRPRGTPPPGSWPAPPDE